MTVTLHCGDCLDVLDTLPADQYDAVVTDPPYHLTSIVKRFGANGSTAAQKGSDGLFQRASRGFMGQQWDGGDIAFRPETWAKLLRVLKPGGHLVAFNHSRTYHHMALAIEAAGFEARDSFLYAYDPGTAWGDFLASLTPDQIDALGRATAAADSPLLAWMYGTGFPKSHDVSKGIDKALGAEREVVGSKFGLPGYREGPTGKNSVYGKGVANGSASCAITAPATPEAAAWEGWGTALKPAFEPILLARKPLAEASVARQHLATGTGGLNIDAARIGGGVVRPTTTGGIARKDKLVCGEIAGPPAAPISTTKGRWPANVVTDGSPAVVSRFPVDASGSPARFFYSAKANKADRAGSTHPTVKPQSLMRWLVRLVTAPGGRVLDPFGGSGATGWAAHSEGRNCDLIEMTPEYQEHIARRIAELEDVVSEAECAADQQIGLFE